MAPAMMIATLVLSAAADAMASTPPDYEREVKPLLREHCISCHGPVKQKGGLRLDAGVLIDP